MYFHIDQTAELHSKFSCAHRKSETRAVNVLVPSEDEEVHEELNDTFCISVL